MNFLSRRRFIKSIQIAKFILLTTLVNIHVIESSNLTFRSLTRGSTLVADPTNLPEYVNFHKLGLGSRDEGPLRTLPSLLEAAGMSGKVLRATPIFLAFVLLCYLGCRRSEN